MDRVDPGAEPWRGIVEAVIPVDDGLLLGGFSRVGAILASSPDGVRWEDRSGELADNHPGMAIVALAHGSTGTVALLDVSSDIGPRMAISRWADERSWRSSALPVDAMQGVIAAAVVWTGTEYVALGGRPRGGDEPIVQLIVATSATGADWSIDEPPALRLDMARGPDVATVIQGEPVVLATSPSGTNATLVRRDARGAWSAIDLRDIREDQVFAIVPAAEGTLLGGCRGGAGTVRQPMVWTDADDDGLLLAALPLPGADGCVVTLEAADGEWIATGQLQGRAAVWASIDGVAWNAALLPGAPEGAIGSVATDAATINGRWVVVGSDQRSPVNDPAETVAIWVER